MATTAAVVVAKAQRDVISHFMSRDAVAPEKAVPFRPDRRIQRRQFERLCAAGVLRTGSHGGHYLDIPAWDAYGRKRRRRVGALLGASLAIAGGLAAIFA